MKYYEKRSEDMDSCPRSQMYGFKPQYEYKTQYMEVLTGRCPMSFDT